jgi:hypothetical protein
MKQKISFTLLCLCTGFSLAAQDQLSNRWKETQRLSLDKKPVSYTDTLRLQEVTKESMSIRKGSFLYKGTISNDLLDFGYLTFGIMKSSKEEIKLRDEEFIHIFTREAKDMSAADAAAKKEAIDLPARPVDNISPELLAGVWEVYKRQGRNGPLAKIDYTTLITRLSVPEQKTGEPTGTVSTGGGKNLYQIKESKGSDLIATDAAQKEHRIKVWRLSKEELVIEDENNIIYYMKHFR